MFRFLPVFLLFALSSCAVTYDVTVHKDGSARVTASRDTASLSRFYRSGVISGMDTGDYPYFSFTISTVDSLGNYLTFFDPGYVQFRYDSAGLTVKDMQAPRPFPGRMSSTTFAWTIRFDEGIREMHSPYRKARRKRNTVVIFKNARLMRKGKKPIDVRVETR